MTARLRCLFRGHRDVWVRGIYGDEINLVSLRQVYRSWWRCTVCRRWQARRDLGE